MNKNKYIVIFFAMKKEYESFVNLIDNYKKIEINGVSNSIKFNNGEKDFIALTSNTIGKTSSAFLIGKLSELINIELIINVGVAGSLSIDVKDLDIVIARKVAYYDVDLTAFGNQYGQMDNCPLWFEANKNLISKANKIINENKLTNVKFGNIISGDKFITKDNLNKNLLKEFDYPQLCDMESATVAHCAYILNIPFFIIRSVSDTTSQEKNEESYNKKVLEASKNASLILIKMFNI